MAKSTGAKRANQKAKDQARAADLAARGVTRQVCRCPVCHRVVGLAELVRHLDTGCRAG